MAEVGQNANRHICFLPTWISPSDGTMETAPLLAHLSGSSHLKLKLNLPPFTRNRFLIASPYTSVWNIIFANQEGRKEMFYLTMHAIHLKCPREEPEMSQNFSSGVNRMWRLLTSHSFHPWYVPWGKPAQSTWGRRWWKAIPWKNRLSPPEDAVDERLSHGKTGDVLTVLWKNRRCPQFCKCDISGSSLEPFIFIYGYMASDIW